MAKRHPGLVPLSHDHHHGLALAIRLQQGNNALLNDGWTHDRVEQAKRVRHFYEHDLRRHFKSEEEVVFPLMSRHAPGSSLLIVELIRQHREMERLIDMLDHLEGDQLEKNLTALGEVLEKHIRSEERELFEMMQQQLTADLLDEIGEGVKKSLRAD
ncbi:MAG: hemerythrin domain-containing protein [Bacteroidetes bacterium]|nr:hemerythrin domain-containing protein [Bacteroidota bacterium]MCW5897390.1 hemerythrin domain-containing protein [Bacteroidota bacterium]